MLLNIVYNILEKHNFIAIPGLGAFFSIQQTAHIDLNTYSIAPPSIKIGFNADLQATDEKTIQAVATLKHCNSNEAVVLLREIASSILKTLAEKKSCYIPNLGTLTTIDSNLHFIQEAETVFGNEYFGLEAIQLLPKNPTVKIKPLKGKTIIWEKSIRKPIIAVAVIVLMIVGVWQISTNSNSASTNKEQVATIIDSESSINALKQGLEVNKPSISDSRQPQSKIQKPIAQPITSSSKTLNLNLEKGFYVMAGAFKVKWRAIKLVEDLKLKGYTNATILDTNNEGLHRVSIQGFVTNADAKAFKAKESDRIAVEGIWVLDKAY